MTGTNILAVDIGGTHVKFRTNRHKVHQSFDSGADMTPAVMMSSLAEHTKGWKYDKVSLGYPGPVANHRPSLEPHNLAPGWTKFDFAKAFKKPVRMMNDAAMQALGSYKGGRMLFLGLGTGLGSALVLDGLVQPLELAHLGWRKNKTYEEYLGLGALQRDGKKKWRKNVDHALEALLAAFLVDYIVLGGGNAKRIDDAPKYVTIG
ncbi:MAG: ROK family protein, partial [Clostridia bacterium]|nr:ROK family protein [Deltaproteobacteria bacterium]